MTGIRFRTAAIALMATAMLAGMVRAQQNVPDAARTQAELSVPGIYLIPISATSAVNNQTTLTIPAPPPGLFNYVCKLELNASNNGTGSNNTNAVWTSTNFNSWSWKFSLAGVNANYEHVFDMGNPTHGCAKSTAAGTATTFVSPSAVTNTAFTVTAQYFQTK